MTGGRVRVSILLFALALTGCVTTYLPMSGLQRPAAIDRQFANFAGLRLSLNCVLSDGMNKDQTRLLCRKLTRMFENQGATIAAAKDPEAKEALERGDLEVRISARVIHRDIFRFIWVWQDDYTVAQDVTVRDGEGFLLAQQTLIARFGKRVGFSSAKAVRQFSNDFYDQVSQLTFNAKQRRKVLRESTAGVTTP